MIKIIIKNSCNGCCHAKLCKYQEEKEKLEQESMEPTENDYSPIEYHLDCSRYEGSERAR